MNKRKLLIVRGHSAPHLAVTEPPRVAQVVAAGMRGRQGERGEQGAPFLVDAQGVLANRSQFDGEPEDFSYLATDTGELYFRTGAPGGWSGPVPFQGPRGDSAYAVAVANGFVGTEAEWLESLQGADGAEGRSITGASINGGGHLILAFSDSTELDAGLVVGADGTDGTDGTDGAPGADGVDGRGITSMAIDGSNHLIITYTDSSTEDAGLIPGAGGSASWGSIGGTLADQADLQAALTARALVAGLPSRTITASGAVTPADAGKWLICTSETPVTLTIGAEATAAWTTSGILPMFHVLQVGAGAVTVTGDGFSVTLHASDTNVLAGAGAAATAVWRASNAWSLIGRLVAA